MSLSDPLKFFDVTGKVALITGASGAFGAVAAECLSGAGCKVALAAGNAVGGWLGAHTTETRGEGLIRAVLYTVLAAFIVRLLLFSGP